MKRSLAQMCALTLVGVFWTQVFPAARAAAWPFSGKIERVSISSAGTEGNNESDRPVISAEGRFVAFESAASNLAPGDTNQASDVFVRDRQSGQTTRVSVGSSGGEGNSGSGTPSISADGRFVAFESAASNLVTGDANNSMDIFVHDRQTGQTTRVSVSSNGGEGNGDSYNPSISADGSLVAFNSDASNLVSGDTNGKMDIFVHNRQSGNTARISAPSGGLPQSNGDSFAPSFSTDGRFVVFYSDASNLVTGDTNGKQDIFLHDRQTKTTELISVASGGGPGNNGSMNPSISNDGRYVAFMSMASNLVSGDTNGKWDVFVRDRMSGTTKRVSISSGGGQGDGDSTDPSITPDGRYVAFEAYASNLVPGDTNAKDDVFLHDRQTGKTERVSISDKGGEGNSDSWEASISSDGRYIVFISYASNLVSGDHNGVEDIFVHDRNQYVFLPLMVR